MKNVLPWYSWQWSYETIILYQIRMVYNSNFLFGHFNSEMIGYIFFYIVISTSRLLFWIIFLHFKNGIWCFHFNIVCSTFFFGSWYTSFFEWSKIIFFFSSICKQLLLIVVSMIFCELPKWVKLFRRRRLFSIFEFSILKIVVIIGLFVPKREVFFIKFYFNAKLHWYLIFIYIKA